MSPEEWQKIKPIFYEALALAPAERQSFVESSCGGDEGALKELKKLLSRLEDAADFIEEPIVQPVNSSTYINKQIANYKIIREIGRGGMGAVFLAERIDGEFEQEVAIKIARQTIAETDLINRFKRERQILASLNHPNIAKLLDGGVSETGEPFLAMEFVEGETITKFVNRERLSLDERLKLFLKVCAAVQYAHRNLIVHRDLKPGNILVTAEKEPKLLDFGLAKLLDENLLNDSTQTQTAFRALTPAYASPEQLKNEPITTSSDIYSLGIVLYELLTGERPFHFEGKSLEQIIRTITENNPTPPSSVVSGRWSVVSEKPKTKDQKPKTKDQIENPKSEIQNPKSLRGDLDNIVLMALRQEPERRYQSVEQFAEDVERHLKGLPVLARPNTFGYRTGKFIQRNRVGVVAASLIVLAVLTGMMATLWQARLVAHERDQAQQAQTKTEQINRFLQNILSAASPEEKGKDAKVIEVLNDALQTVDTEFAGQPDLKAQAVLTIGQTYGQLGLLDEAETTLRRALALNSELHGEDHTATALSRIYLGAALLNKGRYDESEEILKTAIAAARKISPSGSKDLAFALDVLGEVHVRKREHEKAKPLLQESVTMFNNLLGEQNPDSALSLISLGRAQAFSGDLVAAEATYRQATAIYRQLNSPRYTARLATVLVNLGYLVASKGNYDEGLSMIREAENIFTQKQGESYPLFVAKTYLCLTYFSKGDYNQASLEGNKAIEMGRRLHLENTPDFLNILVYTGLALTRAGRAAEGEPLLRERIKINSATLPKESPALAAGQSALGECLTAQKKYAEAESILKESYETLKTNQGENDSNTVLAKNRLTKLYEEMNKSGK